MCLVVLTVVGCSSKNESAEQSQNADALQSDSITGARATKTIVIDDDIAFPLDSLLKFNSEEELRSAFGDNVKRSIGYMPEGMGKYSNSLLFPGSKNEVEFIWKDTLNFADLLEINVLRENADWATSDGIRIGTSLRELEVSNQKPFSFYGFGWDYSGTVNWEQGHLSDRRIFVCLGYLQDQSSPQYDSLTGDQVIRSDSALSQRANPVVVQLGMRTDR